MNHAFFSETSCTAKLSPPDTDSPLDRADLFSSMPNEIDSSYFEDTTLNNILKSVGVTCQEARNIELNTLTRSLSPEWY